MREQSTQAGRAVQAAQPVRARQPAQVDRMVQTDQSVQAAQTMRSVQAVGPARSTRQGRIVAQSILYRFDHPTAEMVWLTARQIDPKISLATVYRNLEKLVDEGRVGKFAVQYEPDHYEPNLTDHIHARCEICRQIFDVRLRSLGRISDKIRREIDFEVKDCQVMASGVCRVCKNKAKEE